MKKYRICNNTLITISENYPATLRIATICFVHFPNDQILMKTRERKVETIKSNKKMKTKEQSKKWKVSISGQGNGWGRFYYLYFLKEKQGSLQAHD